MSNKGQALAESLVILPALISLLALFFGGVFLASAVFIFENRMDETLICFSYRNRGTCQTEWRKFLDNSVLKSLHPTARWTQNGKIWSADLKFDKPWGGFFELRRELRLPLTESQNEK